MRKTITWLIPVTFILGLFLWYKSSVPGESESRKDSDSLADESTPSSSLARQISNEMNFAKAFDLFLDSKAGHFSSTGWFQLLEQLETDLETAEELISEALADESFDRRLLAYFLSLELFGFNDSLGQYALSQDSVAYSVTAIDWLYRNKHFSAWEAFTDKFVEQLDDQDRLEMLSYLGRPMGERDLPASFSIIGLGVVENAELLRLLRADQSLQVSLRDKLLMEEISPALRNTGLDLLKEAGSAEFRPAINNLIDKSVDASRSQRFLEHLRDRPIGYEPTRLEFHQESVMAGNLEEKQALQSAEIIFDAIRIDPSIPIDESVLARIRDYLENQSISTRGTELRLADIAYYQWISKDQ